MKISKQSRRDGKALFNACRINGVLDEGRVRQAVAALVSRKPRGYVATLHHFHRLVRLDVARRSALVESAVPLPAGLRDQVQATLAARRGPGLDVRFAVNPGLIAGLKVRVGSDIYDGSVAGRLAALAEAV
ncbi:MAG: F0F1 ATP synthase subunit delta [Limisphaerales bacterium]